jgi:hypothetical protein
LCRRVGVGDDALLVGNHDLGISHIHSHPDGCQLALLALEDRQVHTGGHDHGLARPCLEAGIGHLYLHLVTVPVAQGGLMAPRLAMQGSHPLAALLLETLGRDECLQAAGHELITRPSHKAAESLVDRPQAAIGFEYADPSSESLQQLVLCGSPLFHHLLVKDALLTQEAGLLVTVGQHSAEPGHGREERPGVGQLQCPGALLKSTGCLAGQVQGRTLIAQDHG